MIAATLAPAVAAPAVTVPSALTTIVAPAGPVAAVVLAAVFLVAAVAKATTPTATARELAQLGLPAPRLAARTLPPVEAVLAMGLLVRPAMAGPVAVLALLAFTAILGRALRSGRSVTCGCLGPLSRRPITALTLVRNLVLVVLAALASTSPTGPGLRSVAPDPDVVLVAGPTLVLAALVVQVLALRQQIGPIWSVELAGETDAGTGADADGHERSTATNGVQP